MPRDARLIIPGQPHHIVLRGNNRRRLFSFPSDYLRMIRLIGDALRIVGTDVALHEVVLMANHLHMLPTASSKEALATFVKHFAQRYAQDRNSRRDGSGKLFEQRFLSKPMKDDAHYALTHAYIDDNPRRAGIVAAASEYRWSSYHVYADDGRVEWASAMAPLLTPSSWYLALSPDAKRRRALYAEWVRTCAANARFPEHAAKVERYLRASEPYRRRLQRPDGTSAQ